MSEQAANVQRKTYYYYYGTVLLNVIILLCLHLNSRLLLVTMEYFLP